MINRFSFHKGKKGTRFLADRLQNARSYDRIAGFFNSSLLEFAGEALETVSGKIRIICNSELRPEDVAEAQKAEQAQKTSFFKLDPEQVSKNARDRLTRLHRLLSNTEKAMLEIRVLPNEAFGLIHGKAGVICFKDGSRTSFLGSANETFAAWNLNYELVWEDDTVEACDWVQSEFDRLWTHPQAVPLAQAVVKEIERLVDRRELNLDNWKKQAAPAGVLVEAPVYREEFGLWPHQRYFIDLAWKTHLAFGARYVLADQVGLGKTVQLGMVAQLVALAGNLPVLVLLPKTLMEQWQTELWDLLEVPSARWAGRHWIDETGYEHSPEGQNPLLHCPCKIGLVSQGLVTRGSAQVKALLAREWECVLVDEAHRARRKKLPKPDERGPAIGNVDADCNKLYGFLFKIASRTRSMLLSTATPVQMHPIEAWDMLRMLAEANDHVLGSTGSNWRKPELALPYLLQEQEIPEDVQTLWEWLRNPFPPKWEEMNFAYLRLQLGVDDAQAVIAEQFRDYNKLTPDLKTRMDQSMKNLFGDHHPFLRFIVRRTRKYLEDTIDPATNEPYLNRIEVELIDDQPVILGSYLKQGYQAAEKFCKLLARRVRAAGFFKTLLLRRIGSSIKAGLNTVNMMLSSWDIAEPGEDEEDIEDLFEDDDTSDERFSENTRSELKQLTREETDILRDCQRALEQGLSQREGADPKRDVVIEFLKNKRWAEDGCILFSQYFDTAKWIGEETVRLFPDSPVGLYAGGGKSGIWENGQFLKKSREEIKAKVRSGEIKILAGTDAASEGLNLQALGTLINVDLPWNPTRLEQRKGRIQRIGQFRDKIKVLNLRYKDSVEDKVHQVLSGRLQDIHELFGQIPDVLKDVWVEIALDDVEAAKKLIEDLPKMNPFDNRYSKLEMISGWDTWNKVLNKQDKLYKLREGWGQ
ncbi:MAG: hypothetical protein JW904_09350 [Spirochaetales bacterium]|nr:hypothetical protein [Spirochaetales bacterium]